ncbi:MAG: hypothetical protein NXI20_25305 [bacterium]|nr:hypothetical protein [bacterium]
MKLLDHIINSRSYPVWFILAAVLFTGIIGVNHEGVPFAPYSEIRIEQTYQQTTDKKAYSFYQAETKTLTPDFRKISKLLSSAISKKVPSEEQIAEIIAPVISNIKSKRLLIQEAKTTHSSIS